MLAESRLYHCQIQEIWFSDVCLGSSQPQIIIQRDHLTSTPKTQRNMLHTFEHIRMHTQNTCACSHVREYVLVNLL